MIETASEYKIGIWSLCKVIILMNRIFMKPVSSFLRGEGVTSFYKWTPRPNGVNKKI